MINTPRTTFPFGWYWASTIEFGPIVQPVLEIQSVRPPPRVHRPASLAGGCGGAVTRAWNLSIATWLSAVAARAGEGWRARFRVLGERPVSSAPVGEGAPRAVQALEPS